jgi:hypothetical protein
MIAVDADLRRCLPGRGLTGLKLYLHMQVRGLFESAGTEAPEPAVPDG